MIAAGLAPRCLKVIDQGYKTCPIIGMKKSNLASTQKLLIKITFN